MLVLELGLVLVFGGDTEYGSGTIMLGQLQCGHAISDDLSPVC